MAGDDHPAARGRSGLMDDVQRHLDATRDDPPGGASREEWI